MDAALHPATPGTSQVARMIAEDFFGDRLELASRGMSREHQELIQRTSPPANDRTSEGRTWLAMPEVEVAHCHRGHRSYMYPQGIAS